MAVSEQTPYIEYTANGSVRNFALGFDCENQDHLIVLVDDVEPVVGTWSLIGGAVVFNNAPGNGKKITIQRNTPFSRNTDYQSYNNSFRPHSVNGDFDRVWMKLQELGVTDWLLQLYIDRLHSDQKTYIDQKDTQLQDNINSLSISVDQQDDQLQQNIDNLKGYVDQQDDQLRAYLLEEIEKQGVALDQLDEYYNYLMQRLAQIAVQGGWEASFVVDASGKTQQEINDFGGAKWRNKPHGYSLGATVKLENGDIVKSTVPNNINNPNIDMTNWVKIGNLIIVNTVAEMLSKQLKNGDVVRTIGYHNIFDNGGALYTISNSPTNYSITLNNGKSAVFVDDFDVRKFGIQDSKTIDQTIELSRMVAYADSRVYEIDFNNMSIMTPNIAHFTTSRGSVIKGLGFNKIHKIKNLHISNNKSVQLQQGTCCILFLPKENGQGVFKLENVTFDPWVSDYALNYTPPVGEGDGMMMGFLAEPHPDWTGFVRATTKTEYSLDFDNINFETPAVSYNLGAAGFFLDRVTLKKSIGQYLGLYLFPFCKSLHVDDLSGVLKDDADKKGRTLVMSLVHEEAEIGVGGSVQQDTVELLNLKATRFTDSATTIAYKNHSIGAANYKRVHVYDMRGRFECFAGSGVATTFDLLEFENCKDASFTHGVDVNVTKWIFKDCISSSAVFSSTLTHTISSIEAYSSTISKLAVNGYTVATALNYLKLKDSKIVDDTYGLARNNTLHINKVDLINVDVESAKMIECSFDDMTIDGMRINTASIANFIYLRHKTVSGSAMVNARGITSKATQQASTQFTTADAGQTVTLDLNFSKFKSRPALANTVYAELQVSPSLTLSKAFDPPSIAADGSTTTTLTSTGIANALSIGDLVQASFSIYNADIEINAVVSSENTVTVKFKNTGAGVVDLGSGTLLVKKI